MVNLQIHVIPYQDKFDYDFDENKTVLDLKNELIKTEKMKKDNYYVENEGNIMNDDMILKDNGVKNYSWIDIVRIDYIKVKIETEGNAGHIDVSDAFMHESDFKVIKLDENKVIKVCFDIIFVRLV